MKAVAPLTADPQARVGLAAHAGTGLLVSVIMSNYNGSAYLEAAVSSVLNQSHFRLELIVVDDASEDDSVAILRGIAASDSRLRIVVLKANAGPAVARNRALEAAKGEWIAIMDADDLIHPQRIARLLSAADRTGADAIADDLLSFGSADAAGQTLLEYRSVNALRQITAADLVQSDTASSGLASLGYLKPMIRREALGAVRYNQTLRIGEDFDLYCRLLIGGVGLWVMPDPTYLYRRHAKSVSHRLSVQALEHLIAAHDAVVAFSQTVDRGNDRLRAALAGRRRRLVRVLRYQHLVTAIKARQMLRAGGQLLRHPALLGDLVASLADRRHRNKSTASDGHIATLRTIILAAPDRISTVEAPKDAICVAADLLSASETPNWTKRHAMARQLAKLAGQGPINVIAVGPEGLDGLGYLPKWRSARLELTAEDAQTATIPRHVVLEIS